MATPQEEVALRESGHPVTARWRVRGAVALSVIAMLILYWPTTLALSELWLDTNRTTFTHGFIVLAITFWLILRDERLEQTQNRAPSFFALALYVPCSIGWLVAYHAGIETAHELAFPILAWLAVYSVFGIRVACMVAFPVGFLFFAIPLWDVLTPHLQTVSAAMVGHMLYASGISAYVDGSLVHIGVGTFEIAGGCSGLHFVMVGLALGALYGELGRDSIKTRLSLIGLALFLALAANWVRVYVIVVAGYLTNMQHYLVRVEHYRFGWAVFAVMMAVFFWLASRFPASPSVPSTQSSSLASFPPTWRRSCLALGLLVVPAWNALALNQVAPLPSERDMRAENVPGWRGPLEVGDASWTPAFAGADAESLMGYEGSNGRSVSLYVAAYREQKQGKELLGYRNRLINASDSIVESRAISAATHEFVVQDGEARALIRFSYWIDGLQTGSGFVSQIAYGFKSLWSAPLSRVVAVRTNCSSNCEEARQRLDAFASALRSSTSS